MLKILFIASVTILTALALVGAFYIAARITGIINPVADNYEDDEDDEDDDEWATRLKETLNGSDL